MASHKNLRIAVIFGIFIAALTGIQHSAFAACTSPAGIAGGITWNGTDSVIWCDGTNWYALKDTAGAAGSTGQVQFNDGSGAFAADAGLTWDNTNKRLGIGTASPSVPLTVVQSSAGAATAFYGGYVNIFSNLDADKYGLSLIRSRGTAAVPTATQSGDDFASLNFTGYTGSAYAIGAWIAGSQTGAVGTNIPSALRFATSDGTSIPTERMRISSAGNVGIGTTSPTTKLHVVSTDTASTSGGSNGVQTDMAVTPAADSSADYSGVVDRISLSGTRNVTGSIRASYGVATHSGSGTLNTAYGSLGIADNTSSGTIAVAYGAYNYARASSAGPVTIGIGTHSTALTNHASATMTTGYGAYNMAKTTLGTMTTAVGSFDTVQANAPTTVTVGQATRANLTVASGATITTAYGVLSDLSNSGTVANWYGLYIPAISGTAPTTARYPIYVADTGPNYFAGKVGIGTTTPSYDLSFGGDANRRIVMERTTAGTNGYYMVVSAGGAKAATADLNGGDLSLVSGLSTGTGSSNIYFSTATPQGSTSTTDNSQTTKMTIAGNGNVGIGNKSPPAYTLTLGREATRTIGIERSSPNNSGASLIITAGGSVPAVADKGGGNLYLDSGAATGTGSSNIYFRTATPQGSTSTTDNTPDAKMTILGNGNVGIGLTGPTYPFVVSGNVGSGWTLGVAEFRNNSTSTIIRIINTTAGGREWGLSSSGTGANEGVGNFNIFDLTADITRLSINSSGNVGIGTTTPAAKLDVNGFMRLAKNGSAPATCDATIDGAIALTSARRMCVCDATSWKEVNSATACTW